MVTSTQAYEQRIARLKADLVEQGRRVRHMIEAAVEAIFERDKVKAEWVCDRDAVIDRVDVEIERAAVDLLTEVARTVAELDADQIRWILTIVKVNNELERIADEACNIAERVDAFIQLDATPPERFRVMANSVIGIVGSATECLDRADIGLARVVLASDDAVDAFEHAILRDVQQGVCDQGVSVDFAFIVNTMTASLERVGDHCTNIAEQVIYVATGHIVRHTAGHWTDPAPPA